MSHPSSTDERDAALAEGFRVGIEAAAAYFDRVAAESSRRAARLRANKAGASPQAARSLARMHESAATFATSGARQVRELPMPRSMPVALRAAEDALRRQHDAEVRSLAELVFKADDRARRAEAERDASMGATR